MSVFVNGARVSGLVFEVEKTRTGDVVTLYGSLIDGRIAANGEFTATVEIKGEFPRWAQLHARPDDREKDRGYAARWTAGPCEIEFRLARTGYNILQHGNRPWTGRRA